MTATPHVAIFSALGDPTRQRLLELTASGTPSVSDLAADLAISRQAVEKQLRVLERAGLVSRDRRGGRATYEVRSDALAESGAWLVAAASEWDRRLAAVKALAESLPKPETPASS